MWKTLALVAALASSSLALRADNPPPATWMSREQLWELKHSDETLAELDRRKEFFEAEMAGAAVPDWAGEYYDGDGLGKNVHLRLSPLGGFVATWTGCVGLYDLNYGPIEVRANRLKLGFELLNDSRGVGFPGDLTFVRWGERVYLLADDEMKPFVNAINSGHEPARHCVPMCGSFRMRRGDDEKAVSGTPDLPAEYRRLLLDRPVTGRVVRIIDSETKVEPGDSYGWRTTRVEIDLGTHDGVWDGMEFHGLKGTGTGDFQVVRTEVHTSLALVRELVSADQPDDSALEPGICVSTHPEVQACTTEQTAALR